jgi:hypothetical protein
MPALDDKMLSARSIEMKLGGVRDAVQGELERTRGISRAKDQGQELGALQQEHVQRQAELDAALAARDPAAAEAAKLRQDEILTRVRELYPGRAYTDESGLVRDVANAPMTRENAPVKDKAYEAAVRMTETSPLTDSKEKFRTYMQFGRKGLSVKYGMDAAAMDELVNRPEVEKWRDQLGGVLVDGMGLQGRGTIPEKHRRFCGAGQGAD